MKLIPIFILLTVTLASAYHVPEGYAHGSQWGPTIMPISPSESPTVDTQATAGECVSYPSPEGIIHMSCAETAEEAWKMMQRPPPERHVFQDALCCSPVGSTEPCRPYTWQQLNELRWYQTYMCRGMSPSEIINDTSCRERMRTAMRNIQRNPAWLHEHAEKIDTLLQECP